MAFCRFQGNGVITLKEQHLLSKFSTNALCFHWSIFSVHENKAALIEKNSKRVCKNDQFYHNAIPRTFKNTNDPTMYIYRVNTSSICLKSNKMAPHNI